jgi:hypothetical protein
MTCEPFYPVCIDPVLGRRGVLKAIDIQMFWIRLILQHALVEPQTDVLVSLRGLPKVY